MTMPTTSETRTFLLHLALQLERQAAAYRTAAAELNGSDPSELAAAAVEAASVATVIEPPPPERRARGQRSWTPEQRARASRQAKKRARQRKATAAAAPPSWSEGRRAQRERSAAALAKFDDTPRTAEEVGIANSRQLGVLVRWGYLKRKGTGTEKRYVRTRVPFDAPADES